MENTNTEEEIRIRALLERLEEISREKKEQERLEQDRREAAAGQLRASSPISSRTRTPPTLAGPYLSGDRTHNRTTQNTQASDLRYEPPADDPFRGLAEWEEALPKPEDKTMKMMEDFTKTIGTLLERFTEVSRNPIPEKATVGDTFSARVEEDSERFLNAVDRYLVRTRTYTEADKIAAARQQMKGEAKTWAEGIKNTPMTYRVFCDRFLDEFDNPRRRVAAYSRFYATHQTDKETAEMFISEKQALLARLRTNMGAETEVEMVISLLRPAIASWIVGARPTSLEELVCIVRRIEPEVNREYKLIMEYKAPTRAPPPSRNAPSTPCRWCSEWHYSQDCSRNPYNQHQGNGRATGDRARGPPAREIPASSNSLPATAPPGASNTSQTNTRTENRVRFANQSRTPPPGSPRAGPSGHPTREITR